MNFLLLLTLLGLVMTLGILLFGVTAMARGGEFNKKYGNKLMRLRVASQAFTIIALVLYVASASAG